MMSSWRQLRVSTPRSSLPSISNTLMLDTVRNSAGTDGTPTWIMRQAGRYLPEFRSVRAEHNFVETCQDPELASEVTIQPYRRFSQNSLCTVAKSLAYNEVTGENLLDAVIVFSDILTVPTVFGQTLTMVPGKGPVLTPPLLEEVLPRVATSLVHEQLGYVYDAIFATRMKLQSAVPVIGFSGAPYTLFGYMVEGGGSKTWARTRSSFYQCLSRHGPEFLRPLEEVVIDYLTGQYDAGADIVQIFDTNADELNADVYGEVIIPGLVRIVKELKLRRPEMLVSVFAKDYRGEIGLGQLASVVDILGCGWKEGIDQFATRVENSLRLYQQGSLNPKPLPVIQGNLDPAILLTADREIITAQVDNLRQKMKGKRWIANLGHGMMPEMNPLMAKYFLEAVKRRL